MNILTRIVGNTLVALSLIIGVGVWVLVIPAFAGTLGANPLETLLHRSGEIAIWTLGAVLSLTPLRVLFPRSQIVAALNRHRRAIGVSACVYGLLHFAANILYEGGWDGLMRSLSKPFIWYGLVGLSILVILAATSNQFSIRKLGGRNWKRLHRLAYIAAALVIYHQAIAGKGHWHIARWLLFPLAALQARACHEDACFEEPARIPATNQKVRHVAKETITTVVSADTYMTAMNNTPQRTI